MSYFMAQDASVSAKAQNYFWPFYPVLSNVFIHRKLFILLLFTCMSILILATVKDLTTICLYNTKVSFSESVFSGLIESNKQTYELCTMNKT